MLGAFRPLPPPFARTRLALHRLAVYAMAPARRSSTGRIGLRPTASGFATPLFPRGPSLVLVAVDGPVLVVTVDGTETRAPITSLADAAEVIGEPLDLGAGERFDVPAPGDPTAPLPVDGAAVAALADWYRFGAAVLDDLLATTDADDRPSLVQLWPEHFDLAVDLGRQDAGARASWGASPGDDAHPEPYLYVSPWTPRAGEVWNDAAFGGASLPWADLVATPDPRGLAARFFGRCRATLAG